VASQERIIHWWKSAYTANNLILNDRFRLEAASSLPSIESASDSLCDIFDAVCLQRIRLKNDQRVPEWPGEQYVGTS
jgi:hypothetical protein